MQRNDQELREIHICTYTYILIKLTLSFLSHFDEVMNNGQCGALRQCEICVIIKSTRLRFNEAYKTCYCPESHDSKTEI